MLISGHANSLHIDLVNSGVTINSTVYPDEINASTFNWTNYNTKLITYMGCKTAGDGVIDVNSLTALTASAGVEVVVGFKDNFNIPSGENWSKRYHNHLADGYGVLDSLLEANDHIYINPNVKSGHIWHHGNENMTITLNNNKNKKVSTSKSKNILSMEKQNVLASDISSIVTNISDYYPNFNVNNYEMIRNTTTVSNINTKETFEIEYIDFVLKVGDFVTNAGFTIQSMDNKVIKIIDNNIDITKQEDALKTPEKFTKDVSSMKLDMMKNAVISEIEGKYQNAIVEGDVEYKYYYDIETDKKYIIYSVPSVIKNSQMLDSVLYDSVKIEI